MAGGAKKIQSQRVTNKASLTLRSDLFLFFSIAFEHAFHNKLNTFFPCAQTFPQIQIPDQLQPKRWGRRVKVRQSARLICKSCRQIVRENWITRFSIDLQ